MHSLGRCRPPVPVRETTESTDVLLQERCIHEKDLGRWRFSGVLGVSGVSPEDAAAVPPDVADEELPPLGGELLLGDGSPELIPESRLSFTTIKTDRKELYIIQIYKMRK